MSWWQDLPSQINPSLITIGSFEVRWYSVMYLVGFAVVYALIRYRLKTEKRFDYDKDLILDGFIWGIIGVILGGRLGYVLFYGFSYYLANPLEIFIPVDINTGQFTGLSGMSFHGGLVASILFVVLYLKKKKVDVWKMGDLVMPCIPLGYMFGRIGNFINAELYGRVTNSALGVYFYTDSSGLLRHPSQLYEALLEGLVLFLILWLLRKKKSLEGKFIGLYLIGYAVARIIVEFYREPDPHLGFIFGPLTMGQLLSTVMILAGFWIVIKKKS